MTGCPLPGWTGEGTGFRLLLTIISPCPPARNSILAQDIKLLSQHNSGTGSAIDLDPDSFFESDMLYIRRFFDNLP